MILDRFRLTGQVAESATPAFGRLGLVVSNAGGTYSPALAGNHGRVPRSRRCGLQAPNLEPGLPDL